jgi:signal transduction histidine kinase
VREDERGAISREIHDEFGQTLTALRMDLMWQINKLPKGDDELQKCTKSAVSTTDAMLNSVRRICSQLRPSLLDDLGLVAAIEWQAEEASKRSGFECALSLDAPTLGSNSIRDTAVFRILQEALTNVARHADAKRVQIGLTQSGRELVLEVRDDGVGITEENLFRPGSLGLIGMRERAEANGGRVEIESATGGGTIVLLTLPIEQPAVESGTE